MTQAINAALSALGALGLKLNVSANNIANVNTDGFKKSRVILEDADPYGVRASISKVDTPGELVPSADGSSQTKESSNVDLGEEIINLKITERAFEANLKPIKAEEEMTGKLLDILE
jgi:flagellar basal-body rod protein FlgC